MLTQTPMPSSSIAWMDDGVGGALNSHDRRSNHPRLVAASPLISPSALLPMLESARGLVLLDVRWRLGAHHPGGEYDSRGEYDTAHIPGAIYVDFESDLSGPADEQAGRHPLPPAEAVEQTAASWGVGPDSVVVVYDDTGGMSAARAWWLLRWIGHERVHVLNGGLDAWRKADGPLTAAETPPPTVLPPAPGDRDSMPTVDADDLVAGNVEVLLDARSTPRYRGEEEPIDRVAGHIPGAISAPTTDNLDTDGSFLSPDELRRRFERLGATTGKRVAVYCGSGVTAAHEVLALEVAGIRASLFPASWSGWIADPDRPVATGDD
jgi:thiosulfate/3-mercaptopyruvate sulfurtransferase